MDEKESPLKKPTGGSGNEQGNDTPSKIVGPPAPIAQSSHESQKTSKRKGLSFLDISSKRVYYCGIVSCGKRSDRLIFASSNALAYFGIRDRLAIVKICSSCAEKAEDFQTKCKDAVRNGTSIFSIKHEPLKTNPPVVDLDDDGAPDADNGHHSRTNNEDVEVDFDRGDVEGIVKSIMNKFNIPAQLSLCKETALDEANKLGNGFIELEKMMNSVDNTLYSTCKRYNQVFDRRPQPVVIQELEINADGSVRRRPITGDSSVFVNADSLKRLANASIKPPEVKLEESKSISTVQSTDGDMSFVSIVKPSSRKPGPASKTGYQEKTDVQQTGSFDMKIRLSSGVNEKKEYNLLPTPKVVPRLRPKVGDICYVMNKNLLNFWVKGEVLEVVTNIETNQTEFVVHFEPTKNGKPTGGIAEGEGIVRSIRQLSLRQMAYNVPCPFVLPVGSRVIAKFKDELTTDPGSDGQYYAGVIAEPPKAASRNRYLIFFDDGYAQYVFPEDVLLVCETSKLVWNDVYPDSYDFVKEYITRWPNWPMVKLREGALVATEWNGKWLTSRVLETDNCLARVRYENDGREEWIYRGSTRFRPVYRVFEKEKEKEKQQQDISSKENKIPRHDPEQFKNRSVPSIEYKCNDGSGPLFQVGARKSTGRINYYNELEMFTSGGLSSDFINMLDPDLCIEYQGTLKEIKIPESAPKPKEFSPHSCDSACVIEFVPSKDLKRITPLAIPFFFGWHREVSRTSRHAVFYRAPCGIRLKDCSELANYLDITNSNMSIDHFCFDYGVDCLNEFVPTRVLREVKDVSYGKEGVPVQWVNSIDYEDLPFMDYTPERIVGQDVELNKDEDFLVCCDCTDNCQDKSKCACWKLTYEGISFTKINAENAEVPRVGYEHRRLRDHIVSGIFECNSRCKCKQTCSNRVVQKGVQWPLQIFKTSKKGWGIRAVYDMPEGTFICIYSGQILNDQTANEEGKEFGDEYLAELDYIECNEAVKADYESDVTDIEAEDDDSDEEEKKDEESNEDSEPEKDDHADDSNFVRKVKVDGVKKRKFAARRTTGRKTNVGEGIINNDDDMITARATHFSPKITLSKRKRKRVKTRDLYGANEQCYIMDAKSKGNIGRYLNHSCYPNVFVQNVFVDTQDMRFPLVAFFTNSHVKAGTELTWDYHYSIGSVPDKVLYCYCMSTYCRGRLL